MSDTAVEDELDSILSQEELAEFAPERVDDIVKKLILFIEEFCDIKFFPYQTPIAYALVESVILGDNQPHTIIATRQSGKSEILSNVVAGLMVALPVLSKVFPNLLGKFEKGCWVGVFAPVEDQAETLFGRVVSKLTSERAVEFMLDPEIDDKVGGTGGSRGKGKVITLKSGSLCRMQTCNPKAKIESKTYHLAVIDEAQEAEERMIKKSISPMLGWNNGALFLSGTAQSYKSYFYNQIQLNKRLDVNTRGGRKHHHEYTWKEAAKYNKNYALYIQKEKLNIGEDSPEFKMSYENIWMLEKGMFVTEDRLDSMYDPAMPLVGEWTKSPIVAGIDVARSNDSTVVTAVWVDWDHVDPFGYHEHRVLDWLEINNVEWESQYFQIIDFLRQYDVLRVGVDAQGVGGAVAERLDLLMPRIEVVSVSSDAKAQNDRWTLLTTLIQRGQLFFPGHSKARRTRRWKKFHQQMIDLERVHRGPYLLAAAPDERGAFDDYPDSLAIACAMSIEDSMPEITVADNPFYR